MDLFISHGHKILGIYFITVNSYDEIERGISSVNHLEVLILHERTLVFEKRGRYPIDHGENS